jgi:hypothetical protein
MLPDAAALNVIRQQFARFGSKCRLYAPMYRQVTLVGLRMLLLRWWYYDTWRKTPEGWKKRVLRYTSCTGNVRRTLQRQQREVSTAICALTLRGIAVM